MRLAVRPSIESIDNDGLALLRGSGVFSALRRWHQDGQAQQTGGNKPDKRQFHERPPIVILWKQRMELGIHSPSSRRKSMCLPRPMTRALRVRIGHDQNDEGEGNTTRLIVRLFEADACDVANSGGV